MPKLLERAGFSSVAQAILGGMKRKEEGQRRHSTHPSTTTRAEKQFCAGRPHLLMLMESGLQTELNMKQPVATVKCGFHVKHSRRSGATFFNLTSSTHYFITDAASFNFKL